MDDNEKGLVGCIVLAVLLVFGGIGLVGLLQDDPVKMSVGFGGATATVAVGKGAMGGG